MSFIYPSIWKENNSIQDQEPDSFFSSFWNHIEKNGKLCEEKNAIILLISRSNTNSQQRDKLTISVPLLVFVWSILNDASRKWLLDWSLIV